MTDLEEIWKDDLLGFKEVGESFGNLIKSIDDTKVVSIEAGYGRGKTFFREHWAKQLKAQGEVVVEVDALMSDHSGDPVLTFIAALVAALPEVETSSGKKLLEKSKQVGGVAVRSVLRLGLRQGADEVIDMVAGEAKEALGDEKAALQDAVDEFGDGLSKMAGELIAAQVMAERVRTKEIPEQLKAIRDALTKETVNNRVVILVDELDRCHPDYAIAFLEAMKLVFGQKGFVFCLFVNADYLQKVADHRFGKLAEGEQYLDKFVDIRLNLPIHSEDFGDAVHELVMKLPDFVPMTEAPEFSKIHAADLAADLLGSAKVSMRQVKKAIARVELVFRAYYGTKIDASLLVYLVLMEVLKPSKLFSYRNHFPRIGLNPEFASQVEQRLARGRLQGNLERDLEAIERGAPELFEFVSQLLPEHVEVDVSNIENWEVAVRYLAPHYIPAHQAMLDAVHKFDASS